MPQITTTKLSKNVSAGRPSIPHLAVSSTGVEFAAGCDPRGVRLLSNFTLPAPLGDRRNSEYSRRPRSCQRAKALFVKKNKQAGGFIPPPEGIPPRLIVFYRMSPRGQDTTIVFFSAGGGEAVQSGSVNIRPTRSQCHDLSGPCSGIPRKTA